MIADEKEIFNESVPITDTQQLPLHKPMFTKRYKSKIKYKKIATGKATEHC